MPAELQPDSAGVVHLGGALDFATVPALYEHTDGLFAGRERVVIDGAGIERANSAGVALLLEWRAEAQRRGCALGFRALPESLLAVARLAGVEELLSGD